MTQRPTTSFALILRGALLGAIAGSVLAGFYAALAPAALGALLAFANGAKLSLSVLVRRPQPADSGGPAAGGLAAAAGPGTVAAATMKRQEEQAP